MKKRLISSMLAAGVLFNASGVLAAQGDVYLKEKLDEAKYTALEMFEDKNKLNILGKEDKFGFEGRNGKIYSMEDANEAWREAKSYVGTLDLLEKKYKAINEKEEDLKVESISAITEKIKKEDKQKLEFAINGKTEAVDLEKLAEAGYSVEYKFNKTSLQATDGKINAQDLAYDKFEYQVVVTKDEDKFETEWKEVTILDATKVEKVTKVGLFEGDKEWDQAVLDNKVEFKAVEYENILGEKNTDKDENGELIFKANAPEVVSAESSDIKTAYYDGSKIRVLKDGTVTFKVKFAGVKEAVEVKVDVVAEQTMKSIKAITEKIEAKSSEAKAEFTVLDQNDETFLGTDNVFVTVKKGTEVAVEGKSETVTSGKVEAKVGSLDKGKYTVEVATVKDNKAGDKLGQFTIEAIDLKSRPDEYTLELAKDAKAEIDLKEDNDNNKTVKLDAKAFVEGVEVDLPAEIDYEVDVKSSNENIEANLENGVVIVSIKKDQKDKLKAGDKASIQLVLKEGSKETKLGEAVEITIVNTTFQVETMTLKKGEKVFIVENMKDEAKAKAVIDAIEEEEITEEMIDSVTYVPSNKKVIVKVKPINGGETFDLDAEFYEKGKAHKLTKAKSLDDLFFRVAGAKEEIEKFLGIDELSKGLGSKTDQEIGALAAEMIKAEKYTEAEKDKLVESLKTITFDTSVLEVKTVGDQAYLVINGPLVDEAAIEILQPISSYKVSVYEEKNNDARVRIYNSGTESSFTDFE